MSRVKLFRLWPLTLAVSILAVGCATPTTATSRNTADLREIHEIYNLAADRLKKAPSQLADITSQKDFEVVHPSAMRGLKQGKYVIVWGVQGQDSGTVLAYEKEALTNGGGVLMANGTVRQMSAYALKAALPTK
jgi:hypothetical protein